MTFLRLKVLRTISRDNPNHGSSESVTGDEIDPEVSSAVDYDEEVAELDCIAYYRIVEEFLTRHTRLDYVHSCRKGMTAQKL